MARKYEKIAHELREGITNGTYPPGSTLPALSELMATYEVARETVRSAVSVLANEGLVTPLSGVGTVVRDLGTVDMHSQPGDAHPAWGSTTGDDSKIETIEASYDVANHEVAQRLGIGRGDQVVHRVRRYYKGRHIVLLHDQWLPGEVGARIHSETGYDPADKDAHERTDLYSFIREAGYQPAQTTERVSTRMPDPDERDVMSIPPGVPVLITLRTTRDASQIELETSTFVATGDRAEQTYTVTM